jgi:predicted dehydrogenase
MDKVQWGIIGCGDVTEVKSGPALYKIKGSSLVAVMRRDGKKAEDYAWRHNVPRWYDDADKLINDPDVNAVYIATPPGSHAEYTIRVAAAGKPVYVEKPMARSFAECRQMLAACERAGVPLWVAYYRRGLPNHLKVKELIDSGAIGEIRLVNIRLYYSPDWHPVADSKNLPWRVDPQIAGGGFFLDLASHQFDFLDYVMGPVESATGVVANQAGLYPAEDVVAATFRFESGVPGNGIWCFTCGPSAFTEDTEIVGSKGRIVFHSFRPGMRLETERGVEQFDIEMPEHVHQPLVQTIVDELMGRGRCPSTGESGARTTRVLDQILKDWRLAQGISF